MTLTRVQALILATGLALVGIAVARADNERTPGAERVQSLEWRHFADNRSGRDVRPDPAIRPPFSRL